MTDNTIEGLYETLLENLSGFDLEEMEVMAPEELRSRWEAAARAWTRLDERLCEGRKPPRDWLPAPVEEDVAEYGPTTSVSGRHAV